MIILDTGSASAEENMRTDARLLENMDDQPILHLYDWDQPSLTFGYFTKPQDYLDLTEIKRLGISIANRPTGGGIIFHTCDLAFSVLIPATHPLYSLNTLQNYAAINKPVAQAIETFLNGKVTPTINECTDLQQRPSFCMAKPTIYDVVIQGRKVAGAAQRRTKNGFLHQGSISLILPEQTLLKTIHDPQIAQLMLQSTFPILTDPAEMKSARRLLKKLLTDKLVKITT